MLRVFILCAQNVLTHDEDITDAYCCVTYEGKDEGPGIRGYSIDLEVDL